MNFEESVLNILAEVAENDIVKENLILKYLKKALSIHLRQ